MPNNNNNNGRNLEIPKAESAMDKMKNEVAAELGIQNYDKIDKGMLPARVHGYVGGNMVRKMIKGYEAALANGGTLPTTTTVDERDKQDVAEDKKKVAETIQQASQVTGMDINAMLSGNNQGQNLH